MLSPAAGPVIGPEKKRCPRFARTAAGCAAYAAGWQDTASRLRAEAGCLGMSARQRATLLAEADAAAHQAARWGAARRNGALVA
jgi:hypothetical protein